jgi:NhaP-type Na+/H+ or K+/H+ antiporter
MKKLGPAILHTGITFIGTMFVTAIICYYFLGIDNIFIGLLLGCVLGGVSSAVVIPIMAGVSAKEDTKVLLTLESVLSDVMCIVTALILIEILRGSATETGVLIQHLLSAFVLAGFIGFLFGVLWLTVLKKLEGKPFSFMITIAALFMLYAVVEYIQVSGAIAALVFGLVLSNKDEIARILKIKTGFVFDQNIKQFHSEVSFLVRTFFFVYLGLTFTFTIGGGSYAPLFDLPSQIVANPLYLFILVLALIFVGIFIIRYIASSITATVDEETKPDKPYIYTMLPRGLAAAVLAALPFTIPEFLQTIPARTDYYILMSGHEELFLNMAFMMIVVTVIATTIGISLIERGKWKKEEAELASDDGKSDDWKMKSRTYRKSVETSPIRDWKAQDDKKTRKVVRKHPPPPPPEPKPKRKIQVKQKEKAKPARKETHPLVKRAGESKPSHRKKSK